jgi:hypothetical protein
MTVTRPSRIRRGIALVSTGIVCLGTAGALVWAVAPDMRGLPTEGDDTRHLAGTAHVLLDPVALSSGDAKKALLKDTPVTSDRVISVLSTKDGAAQVSDVRSLNMNGGIEAAWEASYSVDRTTLEAAADAPENWEVAEHQGLTVGWPVDAQPRDYVGWINPTRTTAPNTYEREETVAGQRAYVYQVSTEPEMLVDDLVRARLPWAMSTAMVADLATEAAVSAEDRARLAAVLPREDDLYDVDYTYQLAATYWVEPETGMVLKTENREIQRMGPILEDSTLAVVPISDVSLASTEASVQEMAERAEAEKRRVTLYGTALPAVLAVLGTAGIVGGGLLLARRPRQQNVLGHSSGSAP